MVFLVDQDLKMVFMVGQDSKMVFIVNGIWHRRANLSVRIFSWKGTESSLIWQGNMDRALVKNWTQWWSSLWIFTKWWKHMLRTIWDDNDQRGFFYWSNQRGSAKERWRQCRRALRWTGSARSGKEKGDEPSIFLFQLEDYDLTTWTCSSPMPQYLASTYEEKEQIKEALPTFKIVFTKKAGW